MSRTARPWKGAGPLVVAGLLLTLTGRHALANDPPALSEQLLDLGRQAQTQGDAEQAATFFEKALELDPQNGEARAALADSRLEQVALQDADDVERPEPPPAEADQPPPAPTPVTDEATLEAAEQLEQVRIQQLTTAVRERQQRARDLLNSRQADAAIDQLRLALSSLQIAEDVPQAVRDQLRREVQVQIQATVRRQEYQEMELVEAQRLQAASAQRARALTDKQNNLEVVNALMTQFDMLMAKGQYNVLFNGGMGDIAEATAPFYDARIVAQHSRALDPRAEAPRAGVLVSQFKGFLAQALAFEELKEYRAMLTWQDVDRAAIPFPDTITIEYPPAAHWRKISEERIHRYENVSLEQRDERTMAIYDELDKPVSMPFGQETPLEDVIKYIKTATQTPALPDGIPIYVDPAGLSEADKTLTSPITLELEGVPLKKTLSLLLKQLDLTYTVKDGLMTITYVSSKDQPTEIRVYPVADLAMIPISLMMGGMGGGMGGMGGGMGGMGGGFRSVPATELPYSTLDPGQTRKLPTKVVSLSPPTADGFVALPAKSERLVLGDISQITRNETVQKALRLLAAEKAPDTVAQLVLWRLAAGMDWNTIRQYSRRWANSSEIALAQQFVSRLAERGGADQLEEQGRLYLTVESADPALETLATDLREMLNDSVVLGLIASHEIPAHPEGPAVACRIKLSGTVAKPEATVLVSASDAQGRDWVNSGKFSLPLDLEHAKTGEARALTVADSLASGLLERLIRVTLLKDRHRDSKGKLVYKIRIDNASPLILNGLMLVGNDPELQAVPTTVLGISVAPRKNMTLPATEDAVERLGLKKGVRAFAADLSGL